MARFHWFWVFCLLATGLSAEAQSRVVWLDELDLAPMKQEWGVQGLRKSVAARPLRVNGNKYEHGVEALARAEFHLALDGKTERFSAVVGIDDTVGKGDSDGERGSARIRIGGDRKWLYEGGLLRGGMPPEKVDIDVTGLKRIVIVLEDGRDGNKNDHVCLADAHFLVAGESPRIVGPPQLPEEPRLILTPPPAAEPRINGPSIHGVRPGSPFIYRIPTTGKRPIRFSANGLPEGLDLDDATGIVTGRIIDPNPRTYRVTLIAENANGKAEREFRIAVGETIALTPPMGWNHWYAHYGRITDAMVREAADIMVKSGMADVGYQYVSIDDCWMNAPENKDPKRVGPLRDESGNIKPNAYFPDMKGLCDYIHAKGLRAGIYTSPGPLTCACYGGAWEHEEQDARQFNDWGFDFLKYDWCSYQTIAKDTSLEELKKPYIRMGEILRGQDRDIVFNLCQYGMGEVWKWGESVGGNCWRTAGDLGFELTHYRDVAARNARLHEYARPGAWNDPDYLLLGYVGNPENMGEPVPCALRPNEQYSYMSLWCLLAAPLFYSGDMTRLDEFTLNILCNPEVIAINQDALGYQGQCVIERNGTEIWRKHLEDGSIAVGFFNVDKWWEAEASVQWRELGLEGTQRVRDLWRQQELGEHENGYRVTLPPRGVLLTRLWPTQR